MSLAHMYFRDGAEQSSLWIMNCELFISGGDSMKEVIRKTVKELREAAERARYDEII